MNNLINNTADKLAKELSWESLKLFMTMVHRADFDFEPYEDGDPHGYILIKEIGLDAAKRGNLTDLKKKKFLQFVIEEDDDRKHRGMLGGWIKLQPKGLELARYLGIW